MGLQRYSLRVSHIDFQETNRYLIKPSCSANAFARSDYRMHLKTVKKKTDCLNRLKDHQDD